MRNGTQKTTTAKKARAKLKLPPKPVFDMPRRRKNGAVSAEVQAAYDEYLTQLRDWLYALPDEVFDRECRKLSRTDLFNLNWKNSYEAYQNGDRMNETA
jgi:hypothetical protein